MKRTFPSPEGSTPTNQAATKGVDNHPANQVRHIGERSKDPKNAADH